MAVPASCAAGKNNPSVSFADSSLYTREPWALPRQYITQTNPNYDDRVKQATANFLQVFEKLLAMTVWDGTLP